MNACFFPFRESKGREPVFIIPLGKGCLSRLGKFLALSTFEFMVVWALLDWLSWSECLSAAHLGKKIFGFASWWGASSMMWTYFHLESCMLKWGHVMQPRMTCRQNLHIHDSIYVFTMHTCWSWSSYPASHLWLCNCLLLSCWIYDDNIKNDCADGDRHQYCCLFGCWMRLSICKLSERSSFPLQISHLSVLLLLHEEVIYNNIICPALQILQMKS